jgi:hypothetical protein
MHPIYTHTHWNSALFNHMTVLTLGMANYTNQLRLTHSKRLNGFDLIQLFKISANFLMTDQVLEFWLPSLSKLNDDLFPFDWSSEVDRHHYLLGDTISTLPVMYTGPPPSAPMYFTPTIPPLSILTWSIIQSSEKIFFISHSIGTNNACEWQLVRVELQESMCLYPSCLQDGHFLVKF